MPDSNLIIQNGITAKCHNNPRAVLKGLGVHMVHLASVSVISFWIVLGFFVFVPPSTCTILPQLMNTLDKYTWITVQ